ncbi:MAG: HNH endonuclease [Azospira sp.]|jgi:hypothetical protein|nr:HNH endonuclease [Azospira sp.]
MAKRVKFRTMLGFLEAHGRPMSRHGTSTYALAAELLSEVGRDRLAGESDKRFCARESAFMSSFRAPKRRRVAKPATAFRPAPAGGVDVSSKDFLATFEWRRVRMMALKKYGPRCMCCGATPEHGAVMNVDHIKPRRMFPQLALDIDNLQILCGECNHGKGNWDMTDWRPAEEQVEIDSVPSWVYEFGKA